MKNCKKFLALFLFLLTMLLSTNAKTAFAAVGDRTTPYSAWNNHRFTFQAYFWESPKEIEVQLGAMLTGEEANYLIQSENPYNDVPAEDEQWILMGFNLKYVSGPEEPLTACDVIWSDDSFVTTAGQTISPISTAIFSNMLEGYGEYDVELYPGGESEVYYGILVKKSAGLPLIRIGTGYDESTYQTIYKWFSTNPEYKETVPAPEGMKAVANSYNSINLNWTALSGMSGYEVYRSTSSTGTFSKIATTTGTSYVDKSLNTGTTYYYKVKGYKTGTSTTYSSFSSVVSAKPTLTVPGSAKAAASSYNSVLTSWAAVSGASGYEVYRATSSAGAYSLVGSTISTSFNNAALTTNSTYYYKIRAYRTIGTTKVYGSYSAVVSAKPTLAVPGSVKAVSSSYNSISTSWTEVSGASGYEVYRATSSTGTYSLVGSTISTSFNNAVLTTNSTYYYKIRAYRTIGTTKVYGSYSAVVSAKPTLAVPGSAKAVSSSYNSISTSWAAVSGASGYEVYRAASSTGTYTRVGSTTATSFKNVSLTTNTTYYYKIRAYRTIGITKVYSSYSTVVSAKPVPSFPANFKASRLSSTSVKLTWSSVTGASGYEIYRSTSKTGTFSLLKSTTSLYYTNTGLTTGRTYYYKLRTYKTVGTKKVYSGWTTTISARP
jgi:fibronectin type 3 domain-containing protein